MSTNTALRPVKISLDQEVTYYADALTKRDTLKWVVIALALAVAVLAFQLVKVSRMTIAEKPLVIRVDAVGRAEAVDLKINSYTPEDREIRFFLVTFFEGFYSRNHRFTPRDYPRSLAYLSGPRLAAVEQENQKTRWYGKFMSSTEDEVDVTVKNIGLDLSGKPFRAHVDYEKIFTTSGGTETKRERWTCEVAFFVDEALATKHPEYVRANPLGFQITDYRPEPAL